MHQSDRIQRIKKVVKEQFVEAPPSHDWSHVERVFRLCLKIGKKEDANLEVLKLAALLHDIARRKQDETQGEIDHAFYGAKKARNILNQYNFSKKTIQQVLHCIKSHRFRNDIPPRSKEAKILFDADKLDSIGAIGIARAFAFVGEIGAKLYEREILYRGKIEETKIYSKSDTGYREFLVKLRKIKRKMQTDTGKTIAKERDHFMRKFFHRLQEEVQGNQ